MKVSGVQNNTGPPIDFRCMDKIKKYLQNIFLEEIHMGQWWQDFHFCVNYRFKCAEIK